MDSTVIATGKRLKYLTALLNSKLYVNQLLINAPKTGTGDAIISVQALNPLFVYVPSDEEEKPFVKIVNKILAKKAKNPNADISKLEAEIDKLVYQLYDLTAEEIAFVESL